ncbi:glycosyl hydrolase 108 family protein [Sedimentitalea sp.]|uniref:glycosyl hydrolase 108 family protein n=1 Tax=Sedimentitalea sp. TaxID=2048915 RepID=UPI003298BA9A
MSDVEKSPEELKLEYNKLWVDAFKWLIGSVVIGVVTLAISAKIQNREIDLKKLEQERLFLEAFLDHALEADILARIRLAHYVALTADEKDIRVRWNGYYDALRKLCEENTQKVNDTTVSTRTGELLEASQVYCNVGGGQKLETSYESYQVRPNANLFAPDAKLLSYEGFDDTYEEISRLQGGFVNHPSDPSGATNMGVTIEALAAWRKKKQTVDDVRNLTAEEAKSIFQARQAEFDQIKSPAVRAYLFYASTLHGKKRAIRFLQQAMGVLDDGFLGADSIAEINKVELVDKVLSDAVCINVTHLRNHRLWETFGRGWMNGIADFSGIPATDLTDCYYLVQSSVEMK